MNAGDGTSETPPLSGSPRDSDDFVSAVLAVVADIPPGHVMAYGEIAAVLGTRAARAVGTVLARYGSDLAWWRVVRSGGAPALGHEQRARAHYDAEGTPLVETPGGYRVDVRAARWRP
ncbi:MULTISPECIES: MGMT family protein [unclassified Rathayibacter]|uniref:MGMT family protein n=1 Tax=unclassified Rathayibacter TaxID=2609250 RepID=UPI00188CF128|nr:MULTISPECIES: MGMT family protein [unclassified Rathayibacter]MBF4461673.1 MGMT family protein [Rathayibacter sp. VKM Ac-2879]MBF4503084.1 MGMT family protein [Rathayibacter sp. VKM Ac-2878]